VVRVRLTVVMIQRRVRLAAVLWMVSTLLPLVGCSAGCHPRAGGRCPAPAPINSWLYGPLTLSADGHTISGRFGCGGQLVANEAATRVTLTFVASAVRSGGLACAMVPLSAHLHTELGERLVVDGVTHRVLEVEHTQSGVGHG
jgi:hypothetical protein